MKRDPKIQAAADMVLKHMQGRPGFVGKKNMYVCVGSGKQGAAGCGSFMVTVDVEAGVTPFLTKCWGCKGLAQSRMYRVDQSLVPTHEWYRPDTLDGLNDASAHHVLSGGLIMREAGR